VTGRIGREERRGEEGEGRRKDQRGDGGSKRRKGMVKGREGEKGRRKDRAPFTDT